MKKNNNICEQLL